MKKITLSLVVSLLATWVTAQTYVWKDGNPLVTDPDSITFVQPDTGLQVTSTTSVQINFKYKTKDYAGKPVWMSASLLLTPNQKASKHVGMMAMYNHYTIMRSDECPTAGKIDVQLAPFSVGMAVVSADYEGFGQTDERVQAYCFGEANARASIDALLAAREWLVDQGYTLGDTILNFGYSQGGQTTIAAIKLAQSDEYRDRVHFTKSIAGASPVDLDLTFRSFLQSETLSLVAALPQTIISINELLGLGLDYKNVFQPVISNHWRSWFVSKKFNTDEINELVGVNDLASIMKPAYLDPASEEVKSLINVTKTFDLTSGWTPDADTDLLIIHSQNDDVVPYANSDKLYQFFTDAGAQNVALDNTTLTKGHLDSGTDFVVYLGGSYLPQWVNGQ